MQSPNKNSKHRGIARLREFGAIALMLVSMSLIASCGGGGDGGDSAGDGNKGGQDSAKQAGNGGGGNGGNTGGAKGGETAGDTPRITEMRVIMAATDKGKLNGTRVRLKSAEVRTIVSERAFFVGDNDTERMLVLNVGKGAEVSEGQKVLVAGGLNTPRPALEEKFSLTPEEAKAVNDQEIFLRAPRVTPQEG